MEAKEIEAYYQAVGRKETYQEANNRLKKKAVLIAARNEAEAKVNDIVGPVPSGHTRQDSSKACVCGSTPTPVGRNRDRQLPRVHFEY